MSKLNQIRTSRRQRQQRYQRTHFTSDPSVISSSHRRDSIMGYNDKDGLDNELIFEEPIVPTLSLGQRVAMVGNSWTEFGTAGWIGQLSDKDDD